MDRKTARLMSAGVLCAAGLAAWAVRATDAVGPGALGLDRLVIADADTAFVDESLDSDFKRTLRAREVLYRTYHPASEQPVWVFLAYFDRQREGSQVHSPRHCYPGAGWAIEQELRVAATWREGSVHGLVVNDGSARRLVCYWYQTPGGVLGDVFRLKLALTREALRRRPQEVVYGNVSAPFEGDAQSTFEKLAPWVREAELEVARLYREQDERIRDTE